MDDLEEVKADAVEDVPSEEHEAQEEETPPVEEEDLTDEQLTEEVARLKEEAKNQEDPKEKRHLEQYAGRLQQISKAREKANAAEQEAKAKQDSLSRFEKTLINEVYEKAVDENFGLPYFEKIAKEDPELANKVAREKFGKSAKELIFESKRNLANSGDEDAKAQVTMEELEAKAEHKVAVREANKLFNDLSDDEKETAKKYFDKISGKTILNYEDAIEIAEMAKHYATRNRKSDPIDKEKVLASKANTGISPKSSAKQEQAEDISDMRQKLLNAGIPAYQVDLMYPIK